MKRMIGLLLTLALFLSLVACTSNTAETEPSTADITSATEQTVPTTQQELTE